MDNTLVKKILEDLSYLEALFKTKQIDPNILFKKRPLLHFMIRESVFDTLDIFKLFIRYNVDINIQYNGSTVLDYFYDFLENSVDDIEDRKDDLSNIQYLISHGGEMIKYKWEDLLKKVIVFGNEYDIGELVIKRDSRLANTNNLDVPFIPEQAKYLFKIFNDNQMYVNKYKIIKLLGRGTYGYVYLCEYQNQFYVMKILNNIIATDDFDDIEDVEDIYKKEVLNLKLVSDIENGQPMINGKCSLFPCLNDHFEYNYHDTIYYCIVMEYIQGYTVLQLEECMTKTGYRFDISVIKKYLLYVLNGLEFLNKKGLFHNDLHLGNIMFTDNRLMIIDMGRVSTTGDDLYNFILLCRFIIKDENNKLYIKLFDKYKKVKKIDISTHLSIIREMKDIIENYNEHL